jgi:nicotinate-nucleotide pyrophosphorylase
MSEVLRAIDYAKVLNRVFMRAKQVSKRLKVEVENELYEQGYNADKQDALDVVLDTITPHMVYHAVRAELLYLVSFDTDVEVDV